MGQLAHGIYTLISIFLSWDGKMRAPPPMFECLIPCFVISRRGPAFRQSVVIKVTPTAFVLNQKLRYLLEVLIPCSKLFCNKCSEIFCN